MSCSAVINGIDGASRMSSVSGLKVTPSTAMDFPRRLPPNAFATLRALARLRWSLTATTFSTIRTGDSWSWPVLISAIASFGKQEPPKPGPACRNFWPIRLSRPMPRATSCTLAPTFSARSAISLIKAILVARNELAAYFVQFGGATIGEQNRRRIEVQRPVDLRHDTPGARIVRSDHDPVRVLEV